MSTAIGVILFIVGVGALITSVVLDRRSPKAGPRPGSEPEASTAEEPIEAEVAPAGVEPEPELEAEPEVQTAPEVVPEPEPEAAAEPEAETAPAAPEPRARAASDAAADRAAAAEARLAKLRAELALGAAAVSGGKAPEEPAPQEPAPDRGADAGRVFAAVASVGREPEPATGVEEPRPATEAPEPEPAAEAPEPSGGEGHTHAVPIVSHSDLVMHLRRQHPDLDASGSTIQMRQIHERAHAGS